MNTKLLLLLVESIRGAVSLLPQSAYQYTGAQNEPECVSLLLSIFLSTVVCMKPTFSLSL